VGLPQGFAQSPDFDPKNRVPPLFSSFGVTPHPTHFCFFCHRDTFFCKKSQKNTKKRDFSKNAKNAQKRGAVHFRFFAKKRVFLLQIAPLAAYKVKKMKVPKTLFYMCRNEGVGGEQSGDFFFGSKIQEVLLCAHPPGPILGVDIEAGGGGEIEKSCT
jgi:hypothetical protein